MISEGGDEGKTVVGGRLRYNLGDALAGSDCRVEIVLAYLHAVATETRDAGAVLAGVQQAAEIVALLDARCVRA